MEIDLIKPTEERFSLEDAFKLMHSTVVPVDNIVKKPSLDTVGVVQGVLDTDLEVELVIRFVDGLRRYNKEAFESDLVIYEQI